MTILSATENEGKPEDAVPWRFTWNLIWDALSVVMGLDLYCEVAVPKSTQPGWAVHTEA
jgi:hypothetical protein